MPSKSKWASKTLWANIISIVALGTITIGIDLGLDAETQAKILVGIMAVINIILRFVTKEPIQ